MPVGLIKALLILLFGLPIGCLLLFAAAVIINIQIKEDMKHGEAQELHA